MKPPTPKDIPTTIRVLCRNSAGLLRQMSAAFALHGVNIKAMRATTNADFRGECIFDVGPQAADLLAKVVTELKRLKDVIEVTPS